jgi:hypothetical protein
MLKRSRASPLRPRKRTGRPRDKPGDRSPPPPKLENAAPNQNLLKISDLFRGVFDPKREQQPGVNDDAKRSAIEQKLWFQILFLLGAVFATMPNLTASQVAQVMVIALLLCRLR